MIILGIDPALSVTGYGLLESLFNKLNLIEAGVIVTDSKQTYPQRLIKIHEEILKLIDGFNVEVMVAEKLYAHYRHPTTAYLLGQVKGIIGLACAQRNLPLFEYAATRIKKAVTGYGTASKYQVQRMVADLLKLNRLPKYADVTDALALAIAHSYICRVQL
jgi:crossover junction endodeoxyribonuclease RuvC